MGKQGSTSNREWTISHRTTETSMYPCQETERWLERTGRHDWIHPRLREGGSHLDSLAACRSGVAKVDAIDRDVALVMQAELFGVADGGLDITITDDVITLKAQTSHEVKDEKGKYSSRDTRHAEYQRMIALPHAVDRKSQSHVQR